MVKKITKVILDILINTIIAMMVIGVIAFILSMFKIHLNYIGMVCLSFFMGMTIAFFDWLIKFYRELDQDVYNIYEAHVQIKNNQREFSSYLKEEIIRIKNILDNNTEVINSRLRELEINLAIQSNAQLRIDLDEFSRDCKQMSEFTLERICALSNRLEDRIEKLEE